MVEINQLSPQNYIPSASEKKKSFAMYLLVGILIGVNKELTIYETFHLKQALGWWIVMIIWLIGGGLIAFLPIVGIWIFFFISLGLLMRNGVLLSGALQGRSSQDPGVLVGIGGRLLGIFTT